MLNVEAAFWPLSEALNLRLRLVIVTRVVWGEGEMLQGVRSVVSWH